MRLFPPINSVPYTRLISCPSFSESLYGMDVTTLYACAGDVLSLRCPAASILVHRANFGRFSIAVCNEGVRTNLSVNCFTEGSLEIVKKK